MTQIIIPPADTSYAWLLKPQEAMEEGKPEQYSCTFVWDEDDKRLEPLRKAILEVAEAKFGAKAKQMLEKGQLKNPLRPGSDKEGKPDEDEFKGKVFLTAKSTDKPEVVDRDAEPVMKATDVYSGMQARADIYLFAYDKKGNKGVSAILNSVQKLGDGERKSGRRSAKEAFGDLDEDDAELL